ncbi:hypothetical protein MKZ38_007421 [Zalerion maritima]|uniref:Peroxisomal membrane protein PEX14 n=1 Tax=Zalerion maritima TaxID=339359 RepID=A0AAD5RUS9_9PEZI|nr:hypothetical protein MKZ38_007421 [Zalerion maritima]
MAIRQDIVDSAVTFLQDPSVASSPIENRIAFLQSKNLTKEEVDAALGRAEGAPPAQQPVATPQPSQYPPGPVQQYGGYQQPPYGWQQQQQAPPVPKRDWRDWFIMATVVGGVGFGLYTLSKRYITPLIAPPTPEKLEQDKQQIDEKFDRAFALIDQLSADTTELKNAEQARTERLDKSLVELDSVIEDLKSANRRREDDANRVREDMQGLKDSIPRAMNTQKDMAENRLRDLNTELKSLKTLMSQRMAAPPTAPTPGTSTGRLNGVGSATTAPASSATTVGTAPGSQQASAADESKDYTATTPAANGKPEEGAAPKPYNDYVSSLNRSSPFNSGMPAAKASIPAWQMAMQPKSSTATTPTGNAEGSGSAAGSGSSP